MKDDQSLVVVRGLSVAGAETLANTLRLNGHNPDIKHPDPDPILEDEFAELNSAVHYVSDIASEFGYKDAMTPAEARKDLINARKDIAKLRRAMAFVDATVSTLSDAVEKLPRK